MFVKQLSIFVENKSGRLSEILKSIADAGIDIRAVSIADTTNFGILRLIVDKPDDAEKALKEMGLTALLTDVIAIEIPDRPGGFAEAVECLNGKGISIEYIYAFNSRDDGRASVILRVSDNEKAVDIFEKNSVKVISGKDIYTM